MKVREWPQCRASCSWQVITSATAPHHQIAEGGDGEELGGQQAAGGRVRLNGKVLSGREMAGRREVHTCESVVTAASMPRHTVALL